MTKPATPPPVPDRAPPADRPPDPRLTGTNAGIGTDRPSEDDRVGPHDHDGWNGNT